MMKRLFYIFTALVLIMGMTACGNTIPSSETEYLPQDSDQQTETGDLAEDIHDPEAEDPEIEDSEAENPETEDPETEDSETEVEREDIIMKMNVQIGDTSFIATLEDNVATSELIEMMREAPVTINMSDYSGFEKVGPLGRSLTTDNHQTTTSAGDIVLYSGNQIVMFYGSNSWSYTRIGKIDDLTGWEDALGSGSITAVFSLAE